jgi:hypothetical protein
MAKEPANFRNFTFWLYLLSNGDIYTGDWLSDKMNGQGKYYTPEGKICEGEFKHHKFIGVNFWTILYRKI